MILHHRDSPGLVEDVHESLPGKDHLVVQADRMGHEVPGMRGVYSHITDAMRKALVDALQEMWEAALDKRLKLAPHSPVAILDALLQERAKAKKTV